MVRLSLEREGHWLHSLHLSRNLVLDQIKQRKQTLSQVGSRT